MAWQVDGPGPLTTEALEIGIKKVLCVTVLVMVSTLCCASQ